MSTQVTPIKVLQTVTYGTATKAAIHKMGKALEGGTAVDNYFTLRAQAEALLNGIMNNRGFHEVANRGLFNGQEAYFYSEGNSDVLASYVESKTYETRLYEEREFAGFLAFQLGKDVGPVTYARIVAEKNVGGAAAVFTWKDLGPLILQDLGRSAVQSYGGVMNFIQKNGAPASKGATAKKALKKGLMGAEIGLEGSTEFTTPNGNIAHFDLTVDKADLLGGIAQLASSAVIPIVQGEVVKGISHALIIQNFSDCDLTFSISYQNKESGLLLGPQDTYSGHTIPAYVENGKPTAIEGINAHRSLCGELMTLVAGNNPEGDIAYTIEIKIEGTAHKIVATFDLPQLAKNSSFLLFNPSGDGEEVFQETKGKNYDEAISLSHDDFGVALAHNSTAHKTMDLRTGKEGYQYRSVLAIYDKTEPPHKAGSTPLDGLLFGGRL